MFAFLEDLNSTCVKMDHSQIKDFLYYETVFADGSQNDSPEFFYAVAYSQLQEFLKSFK